MLIAGRYKITDDFKVHNIITEQHPDGNFVYDPFEQSNHSEVLPFWGVMCTTFWGLTEHNRQYLINTVPKNKLEELQFEKFWLFWFCDGDLNDQKEMFFYGYSAKEYAYSILQVFNHLLEVQIDKLINATREEYQRNLNVGGIPTSIEDQIKGK